jgi:hydrogenase maturation protease
MRITVVGVGNTLAADDGVGIHAVGELRRAIPDARVCFWESERGGLDLLDRLTGSETGILIDAARMGTEPPGSISVLTFRKPYTPGTASSLHTIGLDAVLAFGETMGMNLPDEVTVYAVAVSEIETFRESLSVEVEAALPHVIRSIRDHLLAIIPDLQVSGRFDESEADEIARKGLVDEAGVV